jgi:micrococcal nuclease
MMPLANPSHTLLAFACAIALGYRVPTNPLPLPAAEIVVVDGDTIDVGAERFRIANLDAPEIERANCPSERALGERAKAAAATILGEARSIVAYPQRRRDRYGRVVARIEYDGTDFASAMIARGLGRVWRGRASNWC